MAEQMVVTLGDDEYEELGNIVEDIKRDQPGRRSLHTPEGYLQWVIDEFFGARVKQHYIAEAKRQDVASLKAKFGQLKEIRRAN